jgi:L-seryl-tRNA(Ser) seleniumtransferase
MAPDSALDPRRRIPALDALLKESEISALVRLYGRASVRVQVTGLLEELRLQGGLPDDAARAGLPARLAVETSRRLEEARFGRTRRVLNATGVVLHTNLGRSPLPSEVWRAAEDRITAACDLEFDLVDGRRSDRNRRLEALLREATGAEAALVVNNNAAALVLMLAALRDGDRAPASHAEPPPGPAGARTEVLVARGELVEIGGSFRIPEILATAGVTLREVGTTNRVRLADYEAALGPHTLAVLKVHPSNFRVRGFTASVAEEALGSWASRRGIPWLADEGAGLLSDAAEAPLRDHTSLRRLIACGCAAACGSGDKVLGGPQAGLLVGGRDLIERCRRHPWYRVVRPGRAVVVLLEEILRRRLAGEPSPAQAALEGGARLRMRLDGLVAAIGAGEVAPAEAFLGGGAAPDEAVSGEAWSLDHAAFDADRLVHELRWGEPAVVASAREGRLWLDLRSVDPADDAALAAAVRRALASVRGEAEP